MGAAFLFTKECPPVYPEDFTVHPPQLRLIQIQFPWPASHPSLAGKSRNHVSSSSFSNSFKHQP